MVSFQMKGRGTLIIFQSNSYLKIVYMQIKHQSEVYDLIGDILAAHWEPGVNLCLSELHV